MKSLQIINAPLADNFHPSIRAGAYPPLNLASLSAFLRQKKCDVEIEIIDGEISDKRSIFNKVGADVVALSCNSLSYATALQIAKEAKNKGSRVVLGGPHPTFMGVEIIKNRLFVDEVVFENGEYALAQIMTDEKTRIIPNVIYRDKKSIKKNLPRNMNISKLPFPDYEGIDLIKYFQNYQRLYPDKPFSQAFAVYSSIGCAWRTYSGGCLFCAVPHSKYQIKPAELVWREIESLCEKHSADFVWDVSDTFTSRKEFVKEMCLTKSLPDNIGLQIYARSSDIDQEMANMLAQLGVYEVFLGMESSSDQILYRCSKGIKTSDSYNAIKLLNREGIKVSLSIILGLPGENDETLHFTREMVVDILSWADISDLNCSIMLPLPGSKAIKLIEKYLKSKPGDEDLFDADVLRSIWIKHFTNVSYERIVEEQIHMMTLHKRVGTFGLTKQEYHYS